MKACQTLKQQFVGLARKEALLQLKGNSQKAGSEIEKYFSPFREIFSRNDPRFLDINFGADWCTLFVYYLMIKAGYELNPQPFHDKRGTFGLVGIWFEWAESLGKLKAITYEPESGDLVLYDKLLSDSELDHIAVILENNDNHIITAEGNINNRTGIFKREKNEKIRTYIKL